MTTTARLSPVAEMAASPIGGSRALYSGLQGVYQDLRAIFQVTAQQASARLLSYARPDGTIDPRRLSDVTESVGHLVASTFSQGRRVFDGTRALSPYADVMNRWLVFVTVRSTIPQAKYMKRRLPADVQQWLSRPTVREQIDNPLIGYESPYHWVDGKGYQLSDRIWRSGQEMRLRVDALIADGIRSGRSAMDIARDLEPFLVPGRSLRTTRPYGADASYDALRLARTEITRQHGQATIAASKANPFVAGVDWALSGSHGRPDICDQVATLDAGGGRLRDPYPVDEVPVYPAHPHDLCTLRPAVMPNPAGVVGDLRTEMDSGQAAPLTPLSPLRFVEALLGARDLLGYVRDLFKELV